MQTLVVVPCFNEAQRLNVDVFLRFVDRAEGIGLLLVNDGSRDQTLDVLYHLRDCRPAQIDVFNLDVNQGKAEAVRRGMLCASTRCPKYFGYWDADLATPLEPICDFQNVLERRPDIDVVMGSRLPLAGRDIRRRALRRLLGRIFAEVASRVVRLPLYDTQCGAKLFRMNERTVSAFETSFLARWIFDVELLARLSALCPESEPFADCVYEFPLEQWHEIPGSKVRPRDFLTAIAELARISWRYSGLANRAFASGRVSPPTASQSPEEPERHRKAA